MPGFSRSRDEWFCDDDIDVSSGPPDPHRTFRHSFRAVQRISDVQSFMDIYRKIPYFADDVMWAEQQLTRHDCDENCASCHECYVRDGVEVCTNICGHGNDE
jgi:hypothetical protein